ncbi:DUF2304 family protein [Candidatus Uhrbacteria bacterium]|nr:DUF2304 family protein [Candidatus Uhrbacteria bacterium]
MSLIQILLAVLAAVALVRTWKQFSDGHVTRRELAFWGGFWLLAGLAALWPKTTDVAARLLGVGRGADLAIYLSLILLFYLVFRLFVKLEQVERDITKLVRLLALRDANEQSESSKTVSDVSP